MIALAMNKAPFVRPGLGQPSAVDRSAQFLPRPDDIRLSQNTVPFHPTPTADLSNLQRVVSGHGSRYLDNNNSQMNINSLDSRLLDMKPSIQHLNAFDRRMVRMSSGNPMIQNPSLISSQAQMNTGFPYGNSCDI